MRRWHQQEFARRDEIVGAAAGRGEIVMRPEDGEGDIIR